MTQTGRRRSSGQASERAEARRRARRQDVDDPASDSTTARDDDAAQPRPGLLQRLLIPPVAPLPDKPDPLAAYRHTGPAWMRAPRAGAYLLRANPIVWLAGGLVWAIASLVPSSGVTGFAASIGQFGALIGAGWLGWQRPWLYGLAAAVVGVIALLALSLGLAAAQGTDLGASPVAAIGLFLVVVGLPTVLLGALAGWFGGYWRRRLAEARTIRERAQRRRR
ncbi:MAG: hypothetical protein M3295_01780 [Chloroflexota bacterium]|nr:hypothetical protein [Chloroflexota bacterium]